ncbi:substrate-binding periplasmic protein [Rugamonas apoptosis]|uniref:Transporter substrate-binding domain-containing protein n=1 Tax=Rugamonas apoptosis TaxID=2758570 RepID=A0A7W2IKE8_9BURK|nr:transporter substrate-binding domain-containing protein [Rugamonas apoptosis]MBA5687301.1 transporter substrate-binding domain-containing protein [Rugamonas apoptosis]
MLAAWPNWKLRRFALLALAPWLLGAAGPAIAREWLVAGAHFEGVYERAPDGEFTGLGPAIVRRVAQQMNDTVRFELYPWPRAQALVAQGKVDLLVGPYKSPARLGQMAFSQLPFYRDQMVFYARPASHIVWTGDYARLAQRRIVILNGWVYGAAFTQASAGLHTSVANTVESGLLMVAHQHVDLFATNVRNTEPVLARLHLAGAVAALPQALDQQDGYFAFPHDPQHDEFRARFDAAFRTLVERGELKRLGQQYGVAVP